jgi:hypothetical protein
MSTIRDLFDREPFNGFLVRTSTGPVVTETRLEALERRVRSAAEHPLTTCIKVQCVRPVGHPGRHHFEAD